MHPNRKGRMSSISKESHLSYVPSPFVSRACRTPRCPNPRSRSVRFSSFVSTSSRVRLLSYASGCKPSASARCATLLFPPCLIQEGFGFVQGRRGATSFDRTVSPVPVPFPTGVGFLSNPKLNRFDGRGKRRFSHTIDGDGVGNAQEKAADTSIRSRQEPSVVLDDAEEGMVGRGDAGGGTSGAPDAPDAKLASFGKEELVPSRDDGRTAM